jgi:hypothetical protein
MRKQTLRQPINEDPDVSLKKANKEKSDSYELRQQTSEKLDS